MKQSQGLGLLLYETLRERFARNDCKYFCPTTYQFQLPRWIAKQINRQFFVFWRYGGNTSADDIAII